jgi:hypothetical protein
VVRFTPKDREKRDVAVEFTAPEPDFWQTGRSSNFVEIDL